MGNYLEGSLQPMQIKYLKAQITMTVIPNKHGGFDILSYSSPSEFETPIICTPYPPFSRWNRFKHWCEDIVERIYYGEI